MRKLLISKWSKAGVFVICLLPIAALVWRGLHHGLTANPIEFITHATGDWTLRFIVFTLCITPLRKLLALPDLIRFRRMLGLFAFFYGCLHFTTYIWLDKFFDLKEVWKDIAKRPY
ncbi:MAG TPA: ferric reductase-like transmembrane domain-containing protein, partial [Methylomirabilota bacterium]|nr:ferric reductase-like transmembrane domain-containing protein [Methylomirabilota bacterium]